MAILNRPTPEDYPTYYQTYIQKVPEGDLIQYLSTTNISELEALEESAWSFAYAEGKWTIKEVLLHITDTERIMNYRALRIARGDQTPMPGFDQNLFADNSKANLRSSKSLLHEFHGVRQATLSLLESFDEESLNARGYASGEAFTPLALSFIIAGHQLHHLQILKERYFSAL